MLFTYPNNYNQADFKNRISGTELMRRWNLSLSNIQTIQIQAFIEKRLVREGVWEQILPQTINIKTFRPVTLNEMNDCFYLLKDVEKIENEKNITKKSKQVHFTIPVPEGTTWNKIHFRIVHSDRVEVTHPKGMKPFSPDEVGLLRKKRLHALFEKLAAGEYIKADRQDVSDLNKFLKKMFPSINDGNPIKKSTEGYSPIFTIQPES
jgi:hypothetical protein